MPKKVILIPTLKEADPFITGWSLTPQKHRGFLKAEKKDICIYIGGAGKTLSAACTLLAILEEKPSMLWLIGTGGSYDKHKFPIGSVIAAKREIYLEENVSLFPKTFDMFIPECLKRKNILYGEFVTVSRVSEKKEDIEFIKRIHKKAVCENMEGASVAHIAWLFGVNVCEIRAISNEAGIRDKSKWELERSMRNLFYLINEIFEEDAS